MGTTPRKAGKPKAKRARDRCQPLRDLLAINQRQIDDVEKALADPDIPEGIKRGLRALLARLQAFRRRLEAALRKCERQNR